MRGFPPTYLNGPPAPNPHLAATYMANLNKAAAYAAAAQAAANSTMPRHYSYQVMLLQCHGIILTSKVNAMPRNSLKR